MTALSSAHVDVVHRLWGPAAAANVAAGGWGWDDLTGMEPSDRRLHFGLAAASLALPADVTALPFTEARQLLVDAPAVPPWLVRSPVRPPLLWAHGMFPDRPPVAFGGTNFPSDGGMTVSAEGAVAVARQGTPVAAILGTELGQVVAASTLTVGGTLVGVLQSGIGAPAVADRTIDRIVDGGGVVLSAEPYAGELSSEGLQRAEQLMVAISGALVAPESSPSEAGGAMLLGLALSAGVPLLVPAGAGPVPLTLPRDVERASLTADVTSVSSVSRLLDELESRGLLPD